jgi:hypothetical protein
MTKKTYSKEEVQEIAEAAARYGAALALKEFAEVNRVSPRVTQNLLDTANNIMRELDAREQS